MKKFDVTNQVYNIYLKIYYKCKDNECIGISGSVPSIGDFKEFTELKWTSGDYWVTMEPILSNVHFFRYKYIVMDKKTKELIQWERGVDRILDAGILEPIDRVPGTNRIVQRQSGNTALKSVELEDEFEEFTCEFSVNHPTGDYSDVMNLDGNIHDIDLLKMQKMQQDENWMPVKYGEPIKPWKVQVQMKNIESGDGGMWKETTKNNQIHYKYVLQNKSKNVQ